jgi:hypothetical protein
MVTAEQLLGDVWVVDDYADIVRKKRGPEASSNAKRFGGLGKDGSLTRAFVTEEKAFAYMIERSRKNVFRAANEFVSALNRMRKCEKKFSAN